MLDRRFNAKNVELSIGFCMKMANSGKYLTNDMNDLKMSRLEMSSYGHQAMDNCYGRTKLWDKRSLRKRW
jgi:hypothetical protein